MTTKPTKLKPIKLKPCRVPYPAAWRGHWFDAGRPSAAALGEATWLLLETVAQKQQQQQQEAQHAA